MNQAKYVGMAITSSNVLPNGVTIKKHIKETIAAGIPAFDFES